MSEHKRGEERIMRVTEIDGERTSWVDEGRAGALRGLRQLGGGDGRPVPARLLPRGAQVHASGRLVLLGRGERRVR